MQGVLLGTSTLVLPLAARPVADRFEAGWSPEEYQGVGVARQERGARPDECPDHVFVDFVRPGPRQRVGPSRAVGVAA
jgi:hypothetical protein